VHIVGQVQPIIFEVIHFNRVARPDCNLILSTSFTFCYIWILQVFKMTIPLLTGKFLKSSQKTATAPGSWSACKQSLYIYAGRW